jgi:hypothetical protein
VTDALHGLICELGINHKVLLVMFSNVRFLDMCSLKVMIDNAFYGVSNSIILPMIRWW